MPLHADLITQAARLGIPKAATYTYKQLQKLITNTLKKETKKIISSFFQLLFLQFPVFSLVDYLQIKLSLQLLQMLLVP